MKKIFLIFTLTGLMSIWMNTVKNKSNAQQEKQSEPSALKSNTNISLFTDKELIFELELKEDNNLADSFMSTFGMAADSGEVGSGTGKDSSRGTMAVGMSVITTTSTNHVTPPFTPHNPPK